MKYSYNVSEEDYTTMLSSMIKDQDAKPLRRLMLFLLTIGQIGVTVWLCFTRFEKNQWMLSIACSLFLAALVIGWTFAVRFRAKGMLGQIKRNRQLPPDFWKQHKLEETKEGLLLTFGGRQLVCPMGKLSSVTEENGLIWLKMDEKVFDIVPVSEFPSEDKKEDFLQELKEYQDRSARVNAEYENEDDGNPRYLEYPTDGKEWIRTQMSAYRSAYLRYRLFQNISIVKFAATISLIVLCVFRFSYWTLALTIAFAVFLNEKHIVVFSPLFKRKMHKELDGWADGGQIRLAALKNGIRMSGGRQEIFVPYSKIQTTESPKLGWILAWGQLPAVIIPNEAAKTEEGKAFLGKVKGMIRK